MCDGHHRTSLRLLVLLSLLARVPVRGRNANGTICSAEPSICNGSYCSDSIWLRGDSLSGTLPTQLGLLSRLSFRLDLAHNSLSGTLPTQLGLLSQLSHGVSLQGNFLSGTLPTELGLLNQLIYSLEMYDNSLSGTLPSQLGLLSRLSNHIDLSSNPLSGSLPRQVGLLTQLRYLHLGASECVSLGRGGGERWLCPRLKRARVRPARLARRRERRTHGGTVS